MTAVQWGDGRAGAGATSCQLSGSCNARKVDKTVAIGCCVVARGRQKKKQNIIISPNLGQPSSPTQLPNGRLGWSPSLSKRFFTPSVRAQLPHHFPQPSPSCRDSGFSFFFCPFPQ